MLNQIRYSEYRYVSVFFKFAHEPLGGPVMKDFLRVFSGYQNTHHDCQVFVRRQSVNFFLDVIQKYFVYVSELRYIIAEGDLYAVYPELIYFSL